MTNPPEFQVTSGGAVALQPVAVQRKSPSRLFWDRFRQDKAALAGGIVIGLVKALGGQYLPGGTAYDYVWIFVVLIAVLVFRPQGFFGETERVRA